MPGKISSSAFQKPSAPSPTASGRDGQAPSLDLDKQFSPALGALAHADLEADQFLPALRRGADQHQHALGLLLHPGLEVDAVGPDVDVAAGRQVARLPALVLGLPFARQPGDHRGRQVGRVLAQQGSQRLLEVAGREPAQIQDRQQRIQALRPPGPFRQDRRGEADAVRIVRGAAVADLDPADRHRTDAGLDHALGAMAVPDQALAAVRQLQLAHAGKISLGLDLDGLGQQLARAGSQNIRQGIVDRIGLTQAQNIGSTCSWRIALLERFWQARHPPRYAALLTPSSPSFRHSS